MQSLSNLESGTLWLIRQEVSGTLVLEPGHGFLPTQQEHWTPNWGKATREHGSDASLSPSFALIHARDQGGSWEEQEISF